MIRVGMIGLSEGNGHPFSFSAIVNGYSAEGFADSGWPQILAYLETRDATDFGGLGARVTHAWTQDPEITRRLCRAARVEHAVDTPEDLLGEVDAVVVARDDAESHLKLASPFLERGIPVFVDKPLAANKDDLRALLPHLRTGLLMSCSGLRFARELDDERVLAAAGHADELLAIRGSVPKDWLRYGIHILDAALPLLGPARPLAVVSLPTRHDAFVVETSAGAVLEIDCLGDSISPIRLEVLRRNGLSTYDLRDNFSAFRRCLARFFDMVRSGEPVVPPEDTVTTVATLLAGLEASRQPFRRVPLQRFDERSGEEPAR